MTGFNLASALTLLLFIAHFPEYKLITLAGCSGIMINDPSAYWDHARSWLLTMK